MWEMFDATMIFAMIANFVVMFIRVFNLIAGFEDEFE